MLVMGVPRFQRLFRKVAGLDVDKSDLKRYRAFIDHKLEDLLVVAKATAAANGRDVVAFWDLPITAGLRESMHVFEELDEEIEVSPIISQMTGRPLDPPLQEDAEARLPLVVGGLSVALGRTFRLLEPERRNPGTQEWDRVVAVFDLLV